MTDGSAIIPCGRSYKSTCDRNSAAISATRASTTAATNTSSAITSANSGNSTAIDCNDATIATSAYTI